MFVEKTNRIQLSKPQKEWSEVLQNQHAKIRESDSTYTNSKSTFIISWIAKHKSAYVGEYRKHSSHFGEYRFFISTEDGLNILNRDSLPTLLSSIEQFMEQHDFGKREIKRAKKITEKKWKVLDNGVW